MPLARLSCQYGRMLNSNEVQSNPEQLTPAWSMSKSSVLQGEDIGWLDSSNSSSGRIGRLGNFFMETV